MPPTHPNSRFFTFVAGETGPWRMVESRAIRGQALPPAPRLDLVNSALPALPPQAQWMLHGCVSHERYVTRAEKTALAAVQPPLGRAEATCAAMIPLTKNAAWWHLAQDERREILEARSSHIAIGMQYLPASARRLHHCRDWGEPFDFITWFEYAPADAPRFEALVQALRMTEEWQYVERETDIRLVRD